MISKYDTPASKQLLVHKLDALAERSPSKPFLCVPKSAHYTEGFVDISISEFVNAIDRTALWLDELLDEVSPGQFEAIAYQGLNDARYLILLVAAIKTGRKFICLTQQTTPDCHIAVVRETGCKHILLDASLRAGFQGAIQEDAEIKLHEVPSMGEMVLDTKNKPSKGYPYTKNWEDAVDDPVFVVQTSGSTGLPRLRTYTNASLAIFDKIAELAGSVDLAMHDYHGHRLLIPFPLYHVGGITHCLLLPLALDYVPITGPTNELPDARFFRFAVETVGATAASAVPALLEMIVHDPEHEQYLKRLKTIWWGSAPLNSATASEIRKHVPLCMLYGSTEIAFPALLKTDTWNYVSFHLKAGAEFMHRGNGAFELVIMRSEHVDIENQPVFTLFPELQHYYTRDLFAEHQEKEGLWRWCGRIDDRISLADGKPFSFGDFEQKVNEHPSVKTALVGGDGRPHPFLILEVFDELVSSSREECLEQIWPIIEEANQSIPEFGRVRKDFVIFADKGKGVVRLGKGSPNRKKTYDLFEDRIETLYSS